MNFFFFKQKTAYEMRISDWSSDVCSSDLTAPRARGLQAGEGGRQRPDRRDAGGESGVGAIIAQRKSPADRSVGLFCLAGLAARLFAAAEQVEQEGEHVDEVEIEVQRPHHHRLAHEVGAADHEINALDLLRIIDRKSTRLNSSHSCASRMPPS